MDELEVYRHLDAMLPAVVDREMPEDALKAGVVESAIIDLLDAAVGANCLSDEVKAFIRSEYDGGPVLEMLEDLETFIAYNSAV